MSSHFLGSMIRPSIVVRYEAKDETSKNCSKVGYRLCEWAFPVVFTHPVKLFLGRLTLAIKSNSKLNQHTSVTALEKSPVRLYVQPWVHGMVSMSSCVRIISSDVG